MKKIEEVYKLRRQQEIAYNRAKIGTVILIVFGWLILAAIIGGFDPQGTLWWLQISLFIAAIFGCIKLPSPYKPVPFPEITYQDKMEFAGLIDAATYAYYDLIAFLNSLKLSSAEVLNIAGGIQYVGWDVREALRLLTNYLSFRQLPEEDARAIVKEAAIKMHQFIEAHKRMIETVPNDYLTAYQVSQRDAYETAQKVQQDQERQANNPRYIPRDVMTEVWNRDGGKCVKCGSQQSLEFDHIIPVSLGGASTAHNVQLLCQPCNRSKGNREVG